MAFALFSRARALILALVASCLVTIVAGAVLCVAGIQRMRDAERLQHAQGLQQLDRSYQLKHAADLEVEGLRGYLITGRREYRLQWEQGYGAFGTSLSEVHSHESDPGHLARLDELNNVHASFDSNARRLIQRKESGDSEATLRAGIDLGQNLSGRMATLIQAVVDARKATSTSLRAKADAEIRQLVGWLLLLGAIALPLIIALALFAIRRILTPLSDFQTAARAVARGELEARIPKRSDDEFGQVADAFNDMAHQVAQRTTEILEQKRFNGLLLESAGQGILGIDAQGRVTFVNPMASSMTGFAPEDLVGRSLHEALHHSRPNGTRIPEAECPMSLALRDGNVRQSTHDHFWHHDGYSFPVAYVCTPFREDQQVVGAVITFDDISERLATEAMIERMAYYDGLTGLPNRLLFQERLNQALAQARRQNHQAAVFLLDLDRFKVINDSLGHAVGDQLLKTIAERLHMRFKEVDTVARLGGDEFALVLSDLTETTEVSAIAEVLLEEISRLIVVGSHDLVITPSIGISAFPADGADGITLLRNAEAALTRAKAERNGYQFYAPTMNASSAEWLTLESHLRKAEDRGELFLQYQPQLDSKTGAVVGVEALVRWQHPEKGLISPGTFIPLAEATGLIVPISEWVLRTACLQNVAWQRMGLPPIRMAVNLSGRHLKQHAELVRLVAATLEETGLESRFLELELTESILMEDVEATIQTLSDLNDLGVTLSIDDFGTGYSSLSYLKRFPIDTLKIDQAFVREITTDEGDAAIVKAVIALAHSLGLTVIAEGVETADQLAFLRQEGCDELQGYFFSRPLKRDDLTNFLQTRAPSSAG